MAEVPKQMEELLAKFDQNLEAYRNPAYGETEVRVEFINPLFETLGWDVTNKAGYAEPYKDVIHEDAIKVGGATKAPDYWFRIGGTRKFFLEAKKPALNLKEEPTSSAAPISFAARASLSPRLSFPESCSKTDRSLTDPRLIHAPCCTSSAPGFPFPRTTIS